MGIYGASTEIMITIVGIRAFMRIIRKEKRRRRLCLWEGI